MTGGQGDGVLGHGLYRGGEPSSGGPAAHDGEHRDQGDRPADTECDLGSHSVDHVLHVGFYDDSCSSRGLEYRRRAHDGGAGSAPECHVLCRASSAVARECHGSLRSEGCFAIGSMRLSRRLRQVPGLGAASAIRGRSVFGSGHDPDASDSGYLGQRGQRCTAQALLLKPAWPPAGVASSTSALRRTRVRRVAATAIQRRSRSNRPGRVVLAV